MKGSPVATFCTLAESINFINMMNTQLYLCSAALLLTAAQTKAADKQKERPNILLKTRALMSLVVMEMRKYIRPM